MSHRQRPTFKFHTLKEFLFLYIAHSTAVLENVLNVSCNCCQIVSVLLDTIPVTK
jgi:hypothetical protein